MENFWNIFSGGFKMWASFMHGFLCIKIRDLSEANLQNNKLDMNQRVNFYVSSKLRFLPLQNTTLHEVFWICNNPRRNSYNKIKVSYTFGNLLGKNPLNFFAVALSINKNVGLYFCWGYLSRYMSFHWLYLTITSYGMVITFLTSSSQTAVSAWIVTEVLVIFMALRYMQMVFSKSSKPGKKFL